MAMNFLKVPYKAGQRVTSRRVRESVSSSIAVATRLAALTGLSAMKRITAYVYAGKRAVSRLCQCTDDKREQKERYANGQAQTDRIGFTSFKA